MKKGMRWTLGIVSCIGFAGVGYWIVQSDVFSVRTIDIVVEPPIERPHIERLLPSIRRRNLVTLRGADVLKEVEKHPWVESVTVKKSFPDRLFVDVRAKKPVAVYQTKQKLVYLDAKGGSIAPFGSVGDLPKNLPLVTFESANGEADWKLSTLVEVLQQLQLSLGERFPISQLVALTPPYFKAFLVRPRVEVLMSVHNWESQTPSLVDLLQRPPKQIGQAHKINLVFPKKAVVSVPLSE